MDFFDRLEAAKRAVTEKGERKRASWNAKAGKTIPGTRLVVDRLVTVDPSINRTILDLIAKISPVTAKAFNKHMIPYADAALKAWPVSTRLSKSLLSLDFRVIGSTLTGEISNVAPYTIFIHRGQFVRRMIFSRSEQLADKIAADILSGMARV